jgi:membrane protease YdiL (CAAX protease family)
VALLAGFVGLTFVVLLQRVLSRLVSLPQQQVPDTLQYPVGTVLLWVLMSAVVAGVAEEASFRGYMQGLIERRHGPIVAILVTGSLFGLAHFTHPEVTAVLLPYYLAVAAVYGALAYLTNSILPSVVLHAGGNVLSAFDLFTRGRAEWQASPTPKPLIWVTGPDASFWIWLSLAVLVGAAAVFLYITLARTAQRTGPGAV